MGKFKMLTVDVNLAAINRHRPLSKQGVDVADYITAKLSTETRIGTGMLLALRRAAFNRQWDRVIKAA